MKGFYRDLNNGLTEAIIIVGVLAMIVLMLWETLNAIARVIAG